jgi:ankyrin repeat protein/L-ascorbate metabolism protein UlaG (beta-lactamase superfamily)
MNRRLGLLLVALAITGTGLPAWAGEIHQAITAGDQARVAELLRADPTLVRAQNENATRDLPLHTAGLAGNIEIAQLLLDAGADIECGDSDESTPLHDAAVQRQREMVDFLISRGADVNRRDRNGAYALSFALSSGDSLIVQRVLDAGADLNFVSPAGTRLIHYAASRGRWEIVERLLARGDDINQGDFAGNTPLHWAAYTRDPERVTHLIALGASAAVADTSGRTPLHNAAERGNLETARVLIEHGAAIDPADGFGWTPLIGALVSGNVELVSLLLQRGADPNRTVWVGTPIVFLSTRQGNPELVRAMLDAGARVNDREPSFDASLLHVAAEAGWSDVVTLLLERGCDADARDNRDLTARDIAARYGHRGVSDLLAQRGAAATQAGAASADAGLGVGAPRAGEARVWYLGHSGWAIETPNHVLIFDYTDPQRRPDQPSLFNGCIDPVALANKRVTVFASHEHADHYNANILQWREQIPGITCVIGFQPPGATGYEYVAPHATRTLDGVKVTTIPANDSGEGFLVEVDGLTFLHAGDHASRTRDLSGNYAPEIQFLQQRGVRPDIAMLPVSGCNFGDQVAVKNGTEYALETLKPKLFLPMHGGRTSTTRYRDLINELGDRFPQTRMETLYAAGDHFVYRNGKVS